MPKETPGANSPAVMWAAVRVYLSAAREQKNVRYQAIVGIVGCDSAVGFKCSAPGGSV